MTHASVHVAPASALLCQRQVKLVGVNGDGKTMTPFSNLVSFGPVP